MNPKERKRLTAQKLKNSNIIANKYKILAEIGKGASSTVVKAENIQTGQIVAIKIIKSFLQNIHESTRVLREIILLRKLKHPNIINLKEVIFEQKDNIHLYLILQYVQKDIKRIFGSSRQLTFQQIKKVIFQILAGLKYCHECQVLHRDLKPENILAIQKDNKIETVKLCDFGLARTVILDQLNSEYAIIKAEMKAYMAKQNKDKQHNLSIHVVTRWYRAPQLILLQKKYNMAIDMWSVGCIFGELLSMMKENGNTQNQRRPLFPGRACYPLSPPKSADLNYKKVNDFPHSVYDQLSMIFSVLGTPEDISFITDERAKHYIKSFGVMKKKSFHQLFQYLPKQAQDFLESSLKFNPSERISVNQAIKHPLFDDIRQCYETNINILGTPIEMDLQGLSKEELYKLLVQESNYYKFGENKMQDQKNQIYKPVSKPKLQEQKNKMQIEKPQQTQNKSQMMQE